MNAPEKRILDEINITPLTDIFLVLLIIMMVVAPLLNYRGLPLILVSGEPAPADPQARSPLTIAVAADGRCRIEGQEVAPGDIAATIKSRAAEFPDGVLVEVHPDADLQSMTHVLDAARIAGVKPVSIEENAESPAAQDGRPSAVTPSQVKAGRRPR